MAQLLQAPRYDIVDARAHVEAGELICHQREEIVGVSYEMGIRVETPTGKFHMVKCPYHKIVKG